MFCKCTKGINSITPLSVCVPTFLYSSLKIMSGKLWTHFIIKHRSQKKKIKNHMDPHVQVFPNICSIHVPKCECVTVNHIPQNSFPININIVKGSCLPVICIYLLYISKWTVEEKLHTLCDTCGLTDWMTRCCWAGTFCFCNKRLFIWGNYLKYRAMDHGAGNITVA